MSVELTKTGDEKWGITIAPRAGGGLLIKNDPSPGTAAHACGVIKKDMAFERVNNLVGDFTDVSFAS